MTVQTEEKVINESITVTTDGPVLTHIEDAKTLVKTVKGLKITNNDEYINSAEFLKNIKSVYKIIDESRKEITDPLEKIKKRVIEFVKTPLLELKEAEGILKKALLAYQQEQDRIHREAEQKAEAKAKAEEDKRKKLLEERAKKAMEKGNSAKAEMLIEQSEEVYVPTVVQAPHYRKNKRYFH